MGERIYFKGASMTTEQTAGETPRPAGGSKKGGMGKWVLRVVLGLVVLVIVVLVIVYFSIDGIIKSKVVAASKGSTGQETALDSAHLQLGGVLTLSGLSIHNPEGFKGGEFVVAPKTVITVQPSSLMSDTVQVDTIDIDGLTLTLQQEGLKNNLGEILAYTQKQSADAGGKTGSGEAGKSKQLAIGKVRLTNVKVVASGFGVNQTLDLGTIEMDHPTNPDGRLMKVADLLAKILERVATQVAANPQMPEALKKNLGEVTKFIPQAGDLLKNPGAAATQLKGIGDLLKKK
jgi:hypothetical protein